MRAVAAALTLAALGGCEGAETVPVELSWRFADERPCDLAASVHVEIATGDGSPRRVACEDGLAPSRFVVHEARRGEELLLESLTLSGAVLYRGRVTVAGEPRETVTLRFVGGR